MAAIFAITSFVLVASLLGIRPRCRSVILSSFNRGTAPITGILVYCLMTSRNFCSCRGPPTLFNITPAIFIRSEERRVGQEW